MLPIFEIFMFPDSGHDSMAIDTNSELWERAESGQSFRTEMLEFFRANPDSAFPSGTLALEVFDVDLNKQIDPHEIFVPNEQLTTDTDQGTIPFYAIADDEDSSGIW